MSRADHPKAGGSRVASAIRRRTSAAGGHQDARFAYISALTITSQTKKVDSNIRLTELAYEAPQDREADKVKDEDEHAGTPQYAPWIEEEEEWELTPESPDKLSQGFKWAIEQIKQGKLAKKDD